MIDTLIIATVAFPIVLSVALIIRHYALRNYPHNYPYGY
jgi:hypothetical protein